MAALAKKSLSKMLPNDPRDQVSIAYAQADAEYKAAEAKRKAARAEFDRIFAQEIAKLPAGFHELNNSKFSMATVELKNGGTSLDKAMLFSALAKRGIKVSEIDAIVNEASKPRAGQTIIRCVERSL